MTTTIDTADTADTAAVQELAAADLRASARQARALIDALALSTHGRHLRSVGQPQPFPWGTSSARDLVALLVKLASDTADATDTAATAADTDTTTQESAA